MKRNGFMCARRSAENGFTLVELMVALFIFAFVAAAGVGLLAFSVRSQAAATIRLDDLAALRRLNALLTTDFAQTVPRTSRDPGGQRVRAFAGSDGAIEGIVMGYVRAGRSNVEGSPRPALESRRAWSARPPRCHPRPESVRLGSQSRPQGV